MYDKEYEVFLPQPELWKPVNGYEDIYVISNYGRVKNIIKGNILAHKYDKYGVDNIVLSRKGHTKSFSVCKLMVASHLRCCEYLEHKNGVLRDNKLWNIRTISNYKPLYNEMESFTEKDLNMQLVREMFDYKDGGYLVWKKRPPEHFTSLQKYRVFNTINKGKVAGYYNKRTDSKREDFGYWRVGITLGNNLRHFKLHRLIFMYHHGYLPSVVDHKDGNQENNRIDNLREGDVGKNSCNLRLNVNSTTGYKGVTRSSDPKRKNLMFRASIVFEGVTYYLGAYKTAEEAGWAYDEAAKVLHKDFAYLNNVVKKDYYNFNGKFFKTDLYKKLIKDYNIDKGREV